MANTLSRKPKRGPALILAGRARTQEARRKEIVQELRSEARRYRALAIKAERLLTLAESGITARLLCECTNTLGLYWPVERALGLTTAETLDDEARRMRIINRILDGPSAQKPLALSVLTPERALAEAMQIVAALDEEENDKGKD